MRKQTDDPSVDPTGPAVDRRALLRGVALAGAAATGVVAPLVRAKADIWEEGDTQCRPTVHDKTPDYDINDALLADFMNVSETLTGVKPLDRRLGVQYLERYARHADLTALLPQLIKSYRDVAASATSQDDLIKAVQQKIMQDKTVGPAAEQLIYLWYVSAFFLPIDHAAAGREWRYGSPEQYEQSLLWSVVHAHAPMARGGPTSHWARAPRL
ncbi:MAG TPA: sugar dehydrogenase complex small subunit [Pseudolabrys sp.]|nr:sugar dehydrogenase complex small subunit [Pseudolabrys sp.]